MGLDDRPITVDGFTMRDGDRVYLAKIVIVCCAADAQLARLQLSGPAAPVAAAPAGEHLGAGRGRGSAWPDAIRGRDSMPTLEVSSVVRIDPPANTYGS